MEVPSEAQSRHLVYENTVISAKVTFMAQFHKLFSFEVLLLLQSEASFKLLPILNLVWKTFGILSGAYHSQVENSITI